MSALKATLADYLSLRRALGHKLAEHERQLTRFVAGLDDAGASFVTMTNALAFVFDPACDPASSVPAKRLIAVRGFSRYLSAIDPRTEIPPTGLVSYRPNRRVPYMFSDQDVTAVVRAAQASTPSTSTGIRPSSRCATPSSAKGGMWSCRLRPSRRLRLTNHVGTPDGQRQHDYLCLSPARRSSTTTSPTPSTRL
jgi:hypothetical protein